MGNRHKSALAIQEGACNPSGIALAIVDACREIRAMPSYTGTAHITSDPAVRLMVQQLAYICGLPCILATQEYSSMMQSCSEYSTPVFPITKAQRKAVFNLWQRSVGKSYRAFRRSVRPMLAGDGAIVIPFAGMMVAIEPDGYTHS